MLRLVIQGRLDDLNGYTRACRSNPHAGAEMKRKNEEIVSWQIKQQLANVKLKNPVSIQFKWIEKDNRRDPDNISSFGHKVILDALVSCGVLINDSRKFIHDFSDIFATDKRNPRIEVYIFEWESLK